MITDSVSKQVDSGITRDSLPVYTYDVFTRNVEFNGNSPDNVYRLTSTSYNDEEYQIHLSFENGASISEFVNCNDSDNS